VEHVYELAHQFVLMVRTPDPMLFDTWLEHCGSSSSQILRDFARGIRQDYAAVRAALELPWSSEQAEGQINRLKLVKRQMYGRAKFDLLRQRILHAA
jgi:transposase